MSRMTTKDGTQLFYKDWGSGGIKPAYDCIKQFSVNVPTLIAHGDDDQIVPIGAAAMLSSKLVPGAKLKVYRGSPHGLAQTQAAMFNADLLEFIRS